MAYTRRNINYRIHTVANARHRCVHADVMRVHHDHVYPSVTGAYRASIFLSITVCQRQSASKTHGIIAEQTSRCRFYYEIKDCPIRR